MWRNSTTLPKEDCTHFASLFLFFFSFFTNFTEFTNE